METSETLISPSLQRFGDLVGIDPRVVFLPSQLVAAAILLDNGCSVQDKLDLARKSNLWVGVLEKLFELQVQVLPDDSLME